MGKAVITSRIFNSFLHQLDAVACARNTDNLVVRPFKDFSRNRKLSFSDVMLSIISSAGSPVREELLQYFSFSQDTPTSSAFIQARDKILPSAFERLFSLLNRKFPCTSVYKGFHLVAVDGTALSVPFDPLDDETFHPNGNNAKPNSQYHINSAFDILEKRYVDSMICTAAHEAEAESLWKMAERYPEDNVIFIADRNFPTWNAMEHIKHCNKSFLIRLKDIHSRGSILYNCGLPDEEFDLDFSVTLTTRQTNKVKSDRRSYRFLSTTSVFDFINKDDPYYPVSYRIVRFRIDSGYEAIITNLPRDQFSPEEIRDLYHLRWGIETSFRHLKYAADLSAVHSRKRESLKQEIWARLILANLSFIIINALAARKRKRKTKYEYVINVTRAIHLVRDILFKGKGGSPPVLEALILKELLPVRPGRSNTRKVKRQSVICFNYRFS